MIIINQLTKSMIVKRKMNIKRNRPVSSNGIFYLLNILASNIESPEKD